MDTAVIDACVLFRENSSPRLLSYGDGSAHSRTNPDRIDVEAFNRHFPADHGFAGNPHHGLRGMNLLHAFRVTDDRREGLMRIALIATTIAALTVPAYAQNTSAKERESGFPQRDADIAVKKEQAKDTDKGYKAAIKNIPDKKQPNDPWKNVR